MTPGDERFTRSMADLSSRVRDRLSQRPPTDPITALKRRQAALKAYDRERRQRLFVVLGGLGCIVAAGTLAWGIVLLAAPGTVTAENVVPASAPSEPVVFATASIDPATSLAAVSPVDRPRPPPAQAVPETPSVEATTVAPADPQPAPAAPPLPRADIAEAQRLLTGFGFSPGPIDGAPGPRTEEAIRRYQEKRGLAQTGALDSDLLQQLRQDPAPKVVMTAQRPATSTERQQVAQAAPRYRQTPAIFRPVEMAGQQITTWLNSVFR